MGLDTVEIVIKVENRFGIEISDAEATSCTTPGTLIDLVMGKLLQGEGDSCASRRGFHLLRSALMEIAGSPREEIRPDTDLALPRNARDQEAFWMRLRETVGARSWPELVRPPWMTFAIWTSTLLATFAVALLVWGSKAAIVAILATASVTGWLLERITRRFRQRIPPAFATVRALVPFAETAPSVRWSRAEVAREVREIVIEISGLEEELYSEDADFVKELGLD